jgi:hypothetical protein
MQNGNKRECPEGDDALARFSLSPSDGEAGGEGYLEAPPKLIAAFKHLPAEPIFVPPTLDESLLKAARQHLCRPQKNRTNWFRLMPWAVATAGLAAVVLLAYPRAKDFLGFGQSRKAARHGWESTDNSGIQPQSQRPAYVREDLNHDGKVDILDAFLLARKLQGTHVSDPHLDVNGDGLINRKDVEAIAAHAVSLGKGGRS